MTPVQRATPGVRQLVVGHGNTFHDSAIAAEADGHLFAEGLERHTQNKRAWRAEHSAMPSAPALRRWLGTVVEGAITPEAITFLSTWSNKPDLVFADEIVCALGLRQHDPGPPSDLVDGGETKVAETSVVVRRLDHHVSHASFAAMSSPFSECVVLVLDGYGEGESQSWWHFDGAALRRVDGSNHEASLGALYALVTELCGFRWSQGHEWKVMGLAAYGERDARVYEFFRELVQVNGSHLVAPRPLGIAWSPSLQDVGFDSSLVRKLGQMVGSFRSREDPDVERSAILARSFQDAFRDTVVELVESGGRLGLSRNLAFGGGCALNSSANGTLLQSGAFDRLHVPSAPGDDGNALGAVLYHRHIERACPRVPGVLTPYLGSEVPEAALSHTASLGKLPMVRIPDEGELFGLVAAELAAGRIIGWVQGRAEFGPRALGNRSILADPRDPESKARINRAVKFRERYRPLAPAILHEYAAAYFEDYQESPYMERALRFRQEVRTVVPAVVHADGTGRLQTVRREWNPRFHGLLTQFHALTGVPLVVNTSLNVMGRPIVHALQDALSVYVSTSLDFLVVGNYVIGRH